MCTCTPNIRTPFCGKPGCELPEQKPKYRPTPSRLIVGPVKVGYLTDIRDAQGNHVADIRGWGRISYYEGAEEIQNRIAKFVADAINEKLERDPI